MKKILILFCAVFMAACASFGHSDEVWVKNAQNEALYVKIDGLENAAHHKLVFIQHGLASNLNHPAVQEAKKAFLDKGYVVVTFDSRYAVGNSGNGVPFVRLSTYVEDLETVTAWAKTQPFYSEPFALAGHSLGGATVIKYSAMHPEKVNLLIPMTPVISGKGWAEACMTKLGDFCKTWKNDGAFSYTDPTNNKTVSIPYAVVTDCLNYNAMTLTDKIKAKTLVIAAEDDEVLNPDEMKAFADKLAKGEGRAQGTVRTAVVPASGHNFISPQNQADLYEAISEFVK